MTTITLPADLDEVIEEKAKLKGTTAEVFVVDDLRIRYLPPPVPALPANGETLYDFLKDHIGVISSSEFVPGGANLSENTGRKFAELLMKKHRENQKKC